jgi:hypothetical protein
MDANLFVDGVKDELVFSTTSNLLSFSLIPVSLSRSLTRLEDEVP